MCGPHHCEANSIGAITGWGANDAPEASVRDTTSRREFLRNCLGGAVGISAGVSSMAAVPADARGNQVKSRVVVASDSLLRGGAKAHGSVDASRILGLLDGAMQALTQASDPARTWTTVVRPGQLVGIKVNTLGGRGLSTNVLLVEAICERLQQAGIKAADIVVWDRDSTEMERAGFRIRMGGNQVQCFGTDRAGFNEELASFGSVGSRLSNILMSRCDVLINVPVLKDHDGAGVSIALKNMYGVIHNPNKYHPDGCNPFIADVNMLPEIRNKLRLHICDATAACYEGGPAFKPEFTWQANTLIVSEDPVALDSTGWQMIERKRVEHGLKTLTAENREPRYIATAADAEHRIGTNDPRRIELVETRAA